MKGFATSDRAATIFLALSRVPADERTLRLAEQCQADESLRREVEALLAALDLPDSCLDAPAVRRSAPDVGRALVPGSSVGDFIVIGQIGSGGTGVVYLARQQHPPRTVALKVLRQEFVASAVQRRFEIEAELLAQLQHPGIAQIYAAHPGDATTPPFIAMELVNGPPLTQYADDRQLSVRDRVDLLARACDAVQHAHQRGVIHRDLKPGNILVTEDGQPKVLDFGVARTAGAQVSLTTIETETGQLVGTVSYMSPEQVEATPDAIDTRTDIYALGVILFRLLTGRLPFGYDDPPLPELARRIARDDPPRLGALDPALRGDLEIIVARTLAKDKDRRYASAAGLASDLRRYLDGQPIAASADSAWYLVRRQVARYRRALLASAAIGVSLVGLAGYATFQRVRADRTNVQLEEQLATSNIERGRLLGLTGNFPVAEQLVWRELFRQPDSRHARWTLSELYSREPSSWTTAAHEGGTQTVRFSPDGRLLLTAGRLDGLMRLLDPSSGEATRTFVSDSRGTITRAFFTSDGGTIVSGTADALRVWDVATGTVRREIQVRGVGELALAADGVHAITAGAAHGVQVWSLTSGRLMATLEGLPSDSTLVAASPSGSLVVAGGVDGTLAAWDLPQRRLRWRVRAHQSPVRALAIDPRERMVASGAEGLVDLRHAVNGEPQRTLRYDSGSLRNLAFDAGGARLAATGFWRTRIWDLERPSEPPRDVGASESMTDLSFRPDGRSLVTCHGGNGQVRLWDLAADSRTDRWAHGHRVYELAVAPDARWIVTAGEYDVSMWYPGETARALAMGNGTPVHDLAMSRDGRWLASAGAPEAAAVWDNDGRRVSSLPSAAYGRAVAFSDDGRRIFIGESDGTLAVWEWNDEVASGPRRLKAESAEVLAVTTIGGDVVVAQRNLTVTRRDSRDGREILKLRSSAAPFSLALSPDERILAAGTFSGTVDIWEVETGRKLRELKGQTRLVGGLDFSPDGHLLAAASRDGSTRLWDVATGQWLATVASRDVGAERVRFFPGGQRLAIGYEDGEVEIRDLQYFFRYVAGHAEYQLEQFRRAGETLPRADDVLAWSRRILSAPLGAPK